ncbi:Metalloprotease TIKI2 [Bagarius yarrelli]|uniref:Metalloprotease TIKI n=1 Tax=Bagarius yarrelli TaxID=175774 RepID=A0A556V7L4_BAGYA|nr:Metalloprotease TIKI2 [Bagarius yarrelli]
MLLEELAANATKDDTNKKQTLNLSVQPSGIDGASGQSATQNVYSQLPASVSAEVMSPGTATRELDSIMNELLGLKMELPDQPLPTPKSEKDTKPKDQKEPPGNSVQNDPAAENLSKNIDMIDNLLGTLSKDMAQMGVCTTAKGQCASCGKGIAGKMITALGQVWHPEHFVCVACKEELGTKGFFERDGKPYCETDYQNTFSPRCAYCQGPILQSIHVSIAATCKLYVSPNEHTQKSPNCERHAERPRDSTQRELNSFLWTIKRPPPQPPSYLFGTIHVPYTRVWDFVPESSKRAFQSSTSVFFELDLTDPVTVSKLASCQLLPNGENLRSLLPRDIYLRLKRHLDYVRHMMPAWVRAEQRFYADYLFKAIAGDWERKRPVWVMLMVNSLTEWDVRWRGAAVLDLFLAREAERMGKTTGAVEDVEEQCHPLNGLSFSQNILTHKKSQEMSQKVCKNYPEWHVRGVLRAAPKDMQEMSQKVCKNYPEWHVRGVLRAAPKDMQEMSQKVCKNYPEWHVRGVLRAAPKDMQELSQTVQEKHLPHFLNSSLMDHERSTAQQIDSYLRQELIYKRNERMARRVSALLQRSPTHRYFFAFGVGHFLGNHSVLDILRQEANCMRCPTVMSHHTVTRLAGPVHTACKLQTELQPAFDPNAAPLLPPFYHPNPLNRDELDQPASLPSLAAHGTHPSGENWPGTEGTTVTQSMGGPEPAAKGTLEPPEEKEEELPHLLEPDSLSQLEEFGRRQRPPKAPKPHSRQRLFSDLWVRIGYSTTSLPNIQRTDTYVTTRTFIKLQEDQQRRRSRLSHRQETPPPSVRGLATPICGYTLPFLLTCLLTQVPVLRFTS